MMALFLFDEDIRLSFTLDISKKILILGILFRILVISWIILGKRNYSSSFEKDSSYPIQDSSHFIKNSSHSSIILEE